MTKRLIILYATLSFMVLFMAVGFATLSDTLHITGTAEADIPEGLFITEIVETGNSNIDHNSVSFIQYSTTVDSTIDKKNDTKSGGWWPTTTAYEGSVTYKITVFNNTDKIYAFRGLYYQKNLSGYDGNNYVSTSNSDSKIGVTVSFENNKKVVNPRETFSFFATYTIGEDLDDEKDWKTLLNFQFGINVDTEAEARDAVHEKFLDILNTSSTYNELVEKIDDKFDGANEWTSNYIGNVSDAVDADSMTVETLFAGQLNMVIGGEVRPATVLIKHENLDYNNLTGDSYSVKYNNQSTATTYRGCEMTLYLTTDLLNTAYGQAPVYVTVFTCDVDDNGNRISEWYKVGDSYAGKAPIVGYNGGSGGTGSFVTDNWVADAATYEVTDSFSYNVAQGTNIKTLTQVVDDDATNEFQRLLNEAKGIIDDLTYAGTGIELIEKAYSAASSYYTKDADGNPVVKDGIARAQLLPAIVDLDYAVTEVKNIIDSLPKS